jgi:hypothetical protein
MNLATVGDLAAEVVRRYVLESGYENFYDYWQDHKGRNYSVSWLALRLRRAWGPRDLDRAGIDNLHSEIIRLPAPDRRWAVLWLGTLPSPNHVVRPYTSEEMVQTATELGREALLQFLDGQIQCADPDLRPRKDPVYLELEQSLRVFVLKHSAQFLAEKDREFLLQEKFSRSVWYSIGAAQLDPRHASSILHAAFERFNQKMDDYNRALLVLALWNLETNQEIRFILRWATDSMRPLATNSCVMPTSKRTPSRCSPPSSVIRGLIRWNGTPWTTLFGWFVAGLAQMSSAWISKAGRNLKTPKSATPRWRNAVAAFDRRSRSGYRTNPLFPLLGDPRTKAISDDNFSEGRLNVKSNPMSSAHFMLRLPMVDPLLP